MESTQTTQRSAFNPRYWTGFTWLGIILWSWGPFTLNYIRFPVNSYVTAPDGQLIAAPTYTTIADLPFQWGWPFHFIGPDLTVAKAPIPSIASWPMLGLNILLIVLAIVALIYCSQKLLPRFTMISVLVVMTLICLYWALIPLVGRFVGSPWMERLSIAFHFSPILGVVAIRYAEKFGYGPHAFLRWIEAPRIMKPFRRRELNDDTPDDSLAAAAKFDQQGRWQEAIDLYRTVVQKWPEQTEYVDNCLAAIEEKRAAGE